jgi:acyl-CoA synthetase (AMP-forming)/AMP-acid ligase II
MRPIWGYMLALLVGLIVVAIFPWNIRQADRRDRIRGRACAKAGDPGFVAHDAAGRMGRDRAQLHLRHHRQSEGRRLPPPRRLSERARQHPRLGMLGQHPVYLWTLPMFHCNGWCFPWTVAALAGTQRLPAQGRAGAIFELIASTSVTHLCGAPIVYDTLINAPDAPNGARARPRSSG